MYWKLFKNDIKNNLFQIFNIALFIMLSVAFLSAAGQLALRLTISIEQLLETSKTPHILQMHVGEIDLQRMQNFVNSHSEIEEYQILNFLNIDNSLLSFNEKELKDSVYDNGFSIQSKKFDYLLDLDGNLIQADIGEVYVPIFYMSSGIAEKGDMLNIGTHSLKVAGFVRDSQMNSSLSVSKRFIIHEEDYKKIENFGFVEHLIEFRLKDINDSSEIETAYTQEKLESEGPPLMTYALFKVVNAFSDGITIFSLIILSILIIGISLLCIRFSLLAKLEEDYKELAVLKAIGIPFKEIKKIFLGKYIFIAILASILGFLVSFIIQIPLSENIKTFFGESQTGLKEIIIGILTCLAVFSIMFFSMSKIAKRIKKPVFELEEKASPLKIISNFNLIFKLAFSDFISRRKIYLTIAAVFILSVFILTFPMTLYSTISDKSFVNYLGLGDYDIRIDISNADERKTEIKLLLQELNKNTSINKLEVFNGTRVGYKTESGNIENFWIDSGKHESFPIKYVEGRAPLYENEISLSKLKSDDISKKTGDFLTLIINGNEKKVLISGIYSDLTNGGKTAKANFKIIDSEVIRMIIPIELKNNFSAKEFIENYRTIYNFAKFADSQTYLQQIFGNTISMVNKITWVSFFASVLLIFLIVTLFTRMLYLKDLSQNALLKSIGYDSRYIVNQYLIKIGTVIIFGIFIGNLIILSIGDLLASKILSLIGIHGVEFVRNPIFSYIFVPFVLISFTVIAVNFGIKGLKYIDIAQSLKEDV